MFTLKSIFIDFFITVSSLDLAWPDIVTLNIFPCSCHSTSGQRCDSAQTERSAHAGRIIGTNQLQTDKPDDLN